MTFGCHTFAICFSLNINIYVIYDTRTYRVCTREHRRAARLAARRPAARPRPRVHAPARPMAPTMNGSALPWLLDQRSATSSAGLL